VLRVEVAEIKSRSALLGTCTSVRNRMLVSLRGGGGELGNLKP
jgi:hypothetical protein